jgi:hypothetical protein
MPRYDCGTDYEPMRNTVCDYRAAYENGSPPTVAVGGSTHVWTRERAGKENQPNFEFERQRRHHRRALAGAANAAAATATNITITDVALAISLFAVEVIWRELRTRVPVSTFAVHARVWDSRPAGATTPLDIGTDRHPTGLRAAAIGSAPAPHCRK